MKYLICQTLLLMMCSSLRGEEAEPEKEKKTSIDTTNLQPLIAIIEEQLADIRAGNIEKAYQDYTSHEFKKITPLKEFEKFVKDFPVIVDNQSLQFNSINFEKSIATFQGVLNSKGGDALQVEYDLAQENGKWKILGIQLFKPTTSDSIGE